MNRHVFMILLVLLIGILASGVYAQQFGPGQDQGIGGFVDEDGDGFNDLCPDDDGDGIPNRLDEDYEQPMHQYRWGYQHRNGQDDDEGETEEVFSKAFGEDAQGPAHSGYMWGPGDGTGFFGDGPGDGTGFGPGSSTGEATGDGPNQTGVGGDRGTRRQ